MLHQLTPNHAFLSGFSARIAPNAHIAWPPPVEDTDTDEALEAKQHAVKQRVMDGYQSGIDFLYEMLLPTDDPALRQKIMGEKEKIIEEKKKAALNLLEGDDQPIETKAQPFLTEEERFIRQTAKACVNLKAFTDTVKNGIGDNGFSPELRDHYLTQVAWDFDLICQFAKNEERPKSVRRQEILELSKGLGVCSAAIATHIEDAARELNALKIGVPQKFVNTLISSIEQHILAFMHQAKLVYKESHEIHYVATFFNAVANHFDLPQRKDALAFTKRFDSEKEADVLASTVDVTLLERCAKSIFSTITVERTIQQMAEECLARIQDFYATRYPNVALNSFDVETFDQMYEQFRDSLKPGLEPIFGPIDYADVFHDVASDDANAEKYALVGDATLLARSIAHNLRSSEQDKRVLNSFQATTVLGDTGQPIQLKLLGDHIAYVKSTGMAAPRSLEQFVREERENGRVLLKQIEASAANDPRAQQIQDDHWRKTLAPFARKLEAATTKESLQPLIEQATSLLASNQAATTAIASMMADALMRMVGKGNEPAVELLLNAIPAGSRANLINQIGQYGDSALSLAARDGHVAIVKMLVAAGAKLNPDYGHDYGRELRLAAQEGLEGKVMAWLAAGVNVNQTNEAGNTALSLAANTCQPNTARILLAAGAKVNHVNNKGSTPLTLAASRGHEGIVKMLLDKGAKVNLMNLDGSTPLMLAASQGHPDVVRLLLEAKWRVNVNQTNSKGWNALMQGAYNGNKDIVQALLDAGANASHVNKAGKTAQQCATYFQHMHLVPMLQAAEAKAKRESSSCTIM